MDELLRNLRKACPPGLFAQGTRLARENAVSLEREAADELVLRVAVAGRTAPYTVVLYPESAEWSCDCDGRFDACEHAAAAVLAVRDAREKGLALPGAKRPDGAMRYKLDAHHGTLRITRTVVSPDGAEAPLRDRVALLIDGAPDAQLVPSATDVAVDRLLDEVPASDVPANRVEALCGTLAGHPDVWLRDTRVTVQAEPLSPRAVVEDHERGFVLRLVRDPRVSEVVAAGLLRRDDSVMPAGEMDQAGARWEKLPATRVFDRGGVSELVTRVIPELSKRMRVDVRTVNLPRRVANIPPRVQLELEQGAHTLSVTPWVVYGEPPRARVEAGRLVHLSGDVPARDEAAERALVDALRDELNLVPGRKVHLDGADALRFAARLPALRTMLDPSADRAVFEHGLVPQLSTHANGFDLTFVQEGESKDPKRADAAAVLRAWQGGLGLVPLEGGGWAPLPADWLARHGNAVAELLAARTPEGAMAPAALPSLARLCDALDQPRPPGFETLAPLIEGFERIPHAEIPRGFTATFRPYQQRGFDWLCFLRDASLGAVLADDMGLGKTVQAIGALRGRALVVAPRSVVHNWDDELRKFRPGLRVSLFHGPRRKLDRDADVTLTTYAVLRLDAELLSSQPWDVVVLDEAQTIKNPESQAAQAAFGLRAGFRLALSGTPVENRLEELWSLMHFANPGLLGGRSDFRARYAEAVSRGDEGAAARMRDRVRPFVLRRTKREVLPDLPPRTDAVLKCELDERERAVYDAVRTATRADVAEALGPDGKGSVLAALEALLRLRQAACHSALVPGQRAESSSKVEQLIEALVDAVADGHKALVFSQWTSLLDLVEPHLRSEGIAFTRLDGSTRDRAGVVSDFQSESGPPVMLVSLKAGGTGLNLTAADHVFLMDPWWNPAVEDQAADRAHRIGQDRPVMVYRMVARDTVEERILALQDRKRALADAALGGGAAAQEITREDLLALLG